MRVLARFSKPTQFLLLRTTLFFVLFIAISGTLGPFIIGTKLLYGWYFFIYANAGKLLLYSAIIFFLLTRKTIQKIKIYPYTKIQTIFLILFAASYGFLFYLLRQLAPYPSMTSNVPLGLLTHMMLIIMVVFLLLGVFGFRFLQTFSKAFRKELLICFFIAVVFYFGIFYVWTFWPYLSSLVLAAEFFLFSLFIHTVTIIPPYTLSFPTFSITIAQACSGLDSIFLFTSLYIIIWLIDKETLNPRRMALLFIPALIGTIITNIIRVFLLILIGIYVSPQLSATLFHTYLGMILFIIYFGIFWKFLYHWLTTRV